METTPTKRRWPWYIRFVIGSNPLFTVLRAAIWAVLLIVLFKYVLTGIRVRGDSMEPTIRSGQVKFINRMAYARKPPQRGDVVAIRVPDVEVVYLKRIIALPGERLQIREGEVYINGQRLDEPYTKGKTGARSREILLESNQYWLVGDNRTISDQFLIYDYRILGKLID